MGMFDGQVVVVTGGASGIGAATCRAFAAQNAKVAVVDVNGEGALAVATSIGEAATAHVTDVTDGAQVAAMAEAVLGTHDRVDVLVNNVGHWVNVRPFHLSGPEHWAKVLAVNLTQVFSVTQAFPGR